MSDDAFTVTRAVYVIGDGSRVGRGDAVDQRADYSIAPRRNGKIVVIDSDGAWVQFSGCAEPFRHHLVDLVVASPPDFRAFFKERNGLDFPGKDGAPTWEFHLRLAETFADYADLLASRVSHRAPAAPAQAAGGAVRYLDSVWIGKGGDGGSARGGGSAA